MDIDLRAWFEAIKAWLQMVYQQLSTRVAELFDALVTRLYPVIEQLKPIWQDPLWQALGAIILVVLAVLIAIWLVRKLSGAAVGGASFLGKSGSRLLKLLSVPVKKTSSAVSNLFNKARAKKARKTTSFLQTRKAMVAIQYLTTQREWRYKLPWTLLMGETGSGKSELIKSIKKGRRAQILPREKRLTGAGSGWSFFDHGVIIEPEESQFDEVVNQLQMFRPERPLDNIILCISAKTLMGRDSPAALEELGEQLFQQLWQTQKTTGFILPVYLFITHCDEVEGFQAFWDAHGDAVQEQMIGWSNPYRLDIGFNIDWVNEIFEQLLEALQSTQLSVAAGGKEIANIDRFMLYLHEFAKLQAPLKQVMKSAFARSSLQEALPLRGVYFTGQLNQKPLFVEDVFQEKIFAEKHLGSILEKRRFSSNKLLRKMQMGTVAAALMLTANLGYEITELAQFNEFSVKKLQQMKYLDPDCSSQGADTYRLLMGLSEIGDGYGGLSMPLSWFDFQENNQEELVAKNLFENNLFPALECRLKLRADALTVETQSKIPDEYYPQLKAQFDQYQKQLLSFEQAQEDFIFLSGPIDSSQTIASKLLSLLSYLYDNPVPPGVELNSELIVGAVQVTDYSASWMQNNDSLVSRSSSGSYLINLANKLHDALLAHVENVPVQEIQDFTKATNTVSKDMSLPAADIKGDTSEFRSWLKQTKEDWLATSPQNSPCGQISEELKFVDKALVQFGYDSGQLANMEEQFSQSSCDEVVRSELVSLNVPPFGVLFTVDSTGLLSESDELKELISMLEDIAKLPFVKNGFPPVVDSSEPIVLWQVAPLQQLVDVLLSYQEFTADHGTSGLFTNALLERLNQVTERLLSEAMIRPSQQIQQPNPINDLMAYQQRAVSSAVNSFKSAREPLLQAQALLQQQDDSGNVLWLNQQVQSFIGQQLNLLDQLVMEFHLYQPLPEPDWSKANFTQAMFNLNDDKKVQAYLLTQRQQMSYFAFNYSQPLLQYLQNSETGLSDTLVQRWLATLQDLARFERGEPNNQVTLLDDLISTKLVQITNNTCPEEGHFDVTYDNAGWFAYRRDQIERQVNMHCASAGKKVVMDRYMAVANLFNEQLSGYFPFADKSQAGVKDVKPKVLKGFLDQYQSLSSNLQSDLTTLMQNDDSIPQSWLTFIAQMDDLNSFFSAIWQDKAKNWQANIAVQFDAMENDAKGSNQVISWSLNSGNTQAFFPNGSSSITWQPGDTLSLDLRWAKGSAYLPLASPSNSSSSGQYVDKSNLTATFQSQGSWGLFQWLQLYGLDLISISEQEHLLSFYVPVAVKGTTAQLDGPAYVSRSNVLIQVEVPDATEAMVAIPLPHDFPAYAPGQNE